MATTTGTRKLPERIRADTVTRLPAGWAPGIASARRVRGSDPRQDGRPEDPQDVLRACVAEAWLNAQRSARDEGTPEGAREDQAWQRGVGTIFSCRSATSGKAVQRHSPIRAHAPLVRSRTGASAARPLCRWP